jgi:Cation transport ATPase
LKPKVYWGASDTLEEGESSYLSQIINLVKELQESKSYAMVFWCAIKGADIILTKSDLLSIVDVIALSKQTYRKMLQNLWWASGYNIIAIPLAAGILAKWGIFINPAVDAILLSANTVIVAINAQLLKNIKPRQRKHIEHHYMHSHH